LMITLLQATIARVERNFGDPKYELFL